MIYFVRHGETDWNKQKKVQGRNDIPMNETGFKEAKIMADKLRGVTFDMCFASPLQRTQQTARVIWSGPLIIDERIIECNFGGFEGGDHETMFAVVNDPNLSPDDTPNGCESFNLFKSRVFSFIEELKAKHRGKNILVSTHGGVCEFVKLYFQGTKPFAPETRTKNCEILAFNND